MRLPTQLSHCLRVAYPLIQAPMAGYSTPELVAAVSHAGGLGSLAGAYLEPANLRSAIRSTRALSHKQAVFSVNLFVAEAYAVVPQQLALMSARLTQIAASFSASLPPLSTSYRPDFEAQLQVVLEEQVPVLSFTFGILPDRWIKKFKAARTVLIGTATTLDEAQLLARKAIDVIVVQGCEAGGHRAAFLDKTNTSLLSVDTLLAQLGNKITVPLVAAGGIMQGADAARVCQAGASGVQMGTAFLSCPEASTPTCFRELLLNTKQDTTVLTSVVSGKLARGMHNKLIDELTPYSAEIPAFPVQNALTQPLRAAALQKNRTDYMALWAGQKAYLSRSMPASALVQQVVREWQAALRSC